MRSQSRVFFIKSRVYPCLKNNVNRAKLSIFIFSLNPRNRVATPYLLALLGYNLHDLASKGCGHGDNLAPLGLDMTEDVAFLVFLADKRFEGA